MAKKLLVPIIIILILLTGCQDGVVKEQEKPVVEGEGGQIGMQQTPQGEKQPEEKLSCVNECESSTCEGNKYYECTLEENGCYNKTEKGRVKGECGVECFFNFNCDVGKECLSYKCQASKAAEGGLDLADIPEPFLKDTWVVVGANAPSMDVMSAVEITTMLQKESGTKTDAKLDSDITGQESKHNLILIGSPCDNKAVEKVSGIRCEGFKLEDGKAVIKIFSNGKTFLLIAGKTAQDTLRAAKIVADYKSNSLKGTEMIV